MKTELEEKLLKKYRNLFQQELPIYTGSSEGGERLENNIQNLLKQEETVLPIQFGIECGDGWYFLLDKLMGNIQWHIEQENDNRNRQAKIKWLDRLSWILRIRTSHRRKLLRWIGEWIYDKQPRGVEHTSFQRTQIKEKFGGLRFYYYGGDRTIDGMVYLAESMSYNICETCGTTKNVGKTSGWIYTCCKPCYNKIERAQSLTWEKNKE
jgi:hypothetical protein